MYEKLLNHFGLSRVPFIKQISVSDLYISKQIKEASTRLEFALKTDSIALITGVSGSGKTTAMRYFLNGLDPHSFKVVPIAADVFKLGEVVKLALHEMNIEVPYAATAAIRKFKKTVLSLHAEENIKPVIVIDEAQELPVATLSSLKHLLHYDMDSVNRLFMVLCGSAEINEKLKLSSLKSLARRIRVSYDLKPLAVEETVSYVKHQLKWAGITNPIIPDDVFAEMYTMTKGVVSEVNRVCLNLMLLAVSESKDLIELSMLENARIL